MSTLKDPITLRDARQRDAEAIALLHTNSWRRTYRGMMTDEFLDGGALANRRQVWRERLTAPAPTQLVRVAELSSQVIGFVCAFAGEDPVWGSYIDNLHVAHDRHRRGVGRALMRSVATWLITVQPEKGVYLWVMEGNAAARRFYDRLGATNTGVVVKEDPGGGRAPNCRYVWRDVRLLASHAAGD